VAVLAVTILLAACAAPGASPAAPSPDPSPALPPSPTAVPASVAWAWQAPLGPRVAQGPDDTLYATGRGSTCQVEIHALRPDGSELATGWPYCVAGATYGVDDLVVDGSDNFATRFALNRVCVANKTPLISGAAIRLEGQVAVFRPDRADSPCYRCLYKDMDELGESCSQTGVLAPLVGIIGSIQATETIKVLLDIGETLTGRLLVLDALNMEWRTIKLRKDPDCPVCGSTA